METEGLSAVSSCLRGVPPKAPVVIKNRAVNFLLPEAVRNARTSSLETEAPSS